MKRGAIVLLLGLFLCGLGFCAFYFGGSASTRTILHSDRPELFWLKNEFGLNEAEFTRISELHEGYQPRCREMCERIAAKNAELRAMLVQTNTVTEGIEKKLAEIAELRTECQKNMLAHFYAVSRAMPPEQGQRYLAWIQEKTLQFDHRGPMDLSQHMHE